MPRKLTPLSKRLRGTDQPCRSEEKAPPSPQFDPVKLFPPAPNGLDESGAAMWDDIGPQLVAQNVLQVVDLYALEVICLAWQQYRKNVMNEFPQTLQMFTTLRTLFADFGMTPVSRSKMVRTEPPKPDNKFAGHGRKKA